MPAALPIRSDRSPFALRRLACHADDGRVSARLLALANALEGIPREAAAHLAGMTGQTLGDWVHRYNAEGVAGLRDHHRAGRHCRLDEGQQAALKAIILRGPDPKRDGCIAWRARDLCRLVEQRFQVRYRERDAPSLAQPGTLLAEAAASPSRGGQPGARAFQKACLD